MFLNFRKVVVSILFSLMILFMPIVISVPDISANCIVNEITVEQQVIQLNSYSVCNAATKQNSKVNKNKKKKEASFLSKVCGFVFGIVACQIMMITAEALSFTVFRNGFDSAEEAFENVGISGNSNSGPWFWFGLLTGLLYFVGRCILAGLIVNVMTVSPNVMGFIKWFDYAYYAVLVFHFCSIRLNQVLGIIGGCVLGTFLMEMLFG